MMLSTTRSWGKQGNSHKMDLLGIVLFLSELGKEPEASTLHYNQATTNTTDDAITTSIIQHQINACLSFCGICEDGWKSNGVSIVLRIFWGPPQKSRISAMYHSPRTQYVTLQWQQYQMERSGGRKIPLFLLIVMAEGRVI